MTAISELISGLEALQIQNAMNTNLVTILHCDMIDQCKEQWIMLGHKHGTHRDSDEASSYSQCSTP